MLTKELDHIDLKILRIVQSSGRTKRNELAEKVELSIPAVSERLRKLEESGIIRGYHGVLDPQKIGLGVMAFIFVISESSTHYRDIVKRASSHSEILECHAITGEGSHILKIRTQNTATLERLLSNIQSWPGVMNTRTSLVLSTQKESTVLSLSHLTESE
ncbi:Lrp/AsnC family transcriptional regulator [bacterium]|nr:Lrp/AsnC family transcriptional regulator [bacterium]